MAPKSSKKRRTSLKKEKKEEVKPQEKVEEQEEEEVVEAQEDEVDNDEEMAEEDEGEAEEAAEEADEGEAEEADEEAAEESEPLTKFISDGRYRNKQRCLVLCSRGVTARYRHLLEDLRTLMPHHKKESKLDPGPDGAGQAVNDILQLRSCNSVLFLECRKRKDCYMWMGLAGGPSVRFHVSNIHTMDELRLTGNCMKGSRPLLSFDSSFEEFGHLRILKELFTDIFGTPRGHPKSKPFVDRVQAFYYADKKIWVRNYQIIEHQADNALEKHLHKKKSGQEQATSLVEIGPRYVLDPIRIFRGSFGGQTLYLNENYESPNEIRALERRNQGNSYVARKEHQKKRKQRSDNIVVPVNPLDSVFA